ncbi:EAL domain-containing protein [Telmatospirillum siberiense]|uniref:histidine kinase n=1 Tax=Telmatospirillum siberiense TaxID=382514 RepID=A0A2N3PWI3_9PROT|nr:EAL domain-containing protein [Telmatospirillum siberiense]PKU24772.1 hypothetical protein CWS72_09230 [Telmatospirillum siberiense]
MSAFNPMDLTVRPVLVALWGLVLVASFLRRRQQAHSAATVRLLLLVLGVIAATATADGALSADATSGIAPLLKGLLALGLLLTLARLPRYADNRGRTGVSPQPSSETGTAPTRSLIDNLPEALLIHDGKGRLTEINNTLCRMLGYQRHELIGMRISDFETRLTRDELEEIWRDIEFTPPGIRHGIWTRKDGTRLPIEVAIAPLPREDASHPLIIALARDASEHQTHLANLESTVERLTCAQTRAETAIQAKNGFLQSTGRKLRTPLTTILGLTQMIEKGLSNGDDKISDYLKSIHSSSLDLLEVTEELSRAATLEAAATGDEQHSYRTIIEMSPDTICLCHDGVITFINTAGLRLLGVYDAKQVEGQALSKFVHPDYQVLCEGNFSPLIGETAATPMKFLHASGKALDVIASASAAPEGDGNVLVVVRNISDVMRANRDVAAQAKRLNSILDTAVDAIVVTDERGNIETFNRSAETMFGYNANQTIGKPIEILMTEEGGRDHKKKLAAALATRQPQIAGSAREIAGRRQDGSVFPAEISVSLCHLDDRRLFTAIFRDVTERRNFEDYLAHSANHDSLTGLPNRRLLQERLQHAIDHAAVNKSWVAVWFVDLDGFKMVNDVMGHVAGDELLIEAGRRMVSGVKSTDMVARFGGDEFTIINSGVHNRTEVGQAVEHFMATLSRPFILRGRELTLSANVGIAIFPEHAVLASELIVHASAAMLFAKASGRNLYRFFDPVMHSQSAERLTLENELRRGIERDELLLYYQPQIDVASGRIVGLEALVRWKHPSMGLIQPSRFVPIAEQTGLIVPLGAWVLRRACTDLRQLQDMGLNNVSIGVNISARQFTDSDVLSQIQQAIEETGIDPQHLDVEITESTLMNNPEHVISYLERMKGLGIRLSIDDFGTGYSSLNYLKRFPVDTLKIDRSFVIDIADNPKDEAIAVTIITLAHSMGMTVLAEGVEHARQAEILANHRCDIIQGFLYGKPMSLPDAIAELQMGRNIAMPEKKAH